MVSNLEDNSHLQITLKDGTKGHININWNGLRITSKEGKIYTNEPDSELEYYVYNKVIPSSEGTIDSIELDERIQLKLHPQVVTFRPYAPYIGQTVEDIFPPSSDGYYGRMKRGKQESIFIVQDIVGSSMKWLTIADPVSEFVYEAHMIQLYEAEALSLSDTGQVQRILYRAMSHDTTDSKEYFLGLLDKTAPSWKDLSRILTDVSIPNLSLLDTTRETLSQIVPKSFPDEIREQLMALLAFVIEGKIPEVDPVEFKYGLLSVPLLAPLVRGHIRCMIDGIEWPPYVKLMTLAAKKQLEPPKRAISEDVKDIPWLIFWQKCSELFPNWLSSSIELANATNQSGKVLLNLPTTKAQARRSKTAWKKRFATSVYDFRLLGHVNSRFIGLMDLVYIGAAYRWPHRHMKFITRLGGTSSNTSHLQVMTLPTDAAERVTRVLPGVMKVGLSGRISNLSMFSDSSKTWKVPAKPIIAALSRKSSKKRLTQLIGKRERVELYSVTKQDAKILDLIASSINLEDLEIKQIIEFLELDVKHLRSTIKNLIERNIIDIMYETSDDQLISLATIAQGKEDLLRSLAIAFLKNTPTSSVMIEDSQRQLIVLSRLPESTAYDLASSLPERGLEFGLNVRCMRPTVFQSYTHNLYQRILKDDGNWDNDVSAFLSQARSKRKELSEIDTGSPM